MSLTSHQRPNRGASDEWLTPPEIIKALGPFHLDPCAAVDQPWKTAQVQYTTKDDGLSKQWKSFVWCNPPFGPEAAVWLERMAEHGNGIALVPARTETAWFFDRVWDGADAVMFLRKRPHFHYPDGTRAPFNSGAPICLVAYGPLAVTRLRKSGLSGVLTTTWTFPLCTP